MVGTGEIQNGVISVKKINKDFSSQNVELMGKQNVNIVSCIKSCVQGHRQEAEGLRRCGT